MSLEIITEIEAFLSGLKTKFAPEVKAVENAGHDIVHSAVSYIETNGLQDLYAIAATVLTGATSGTAWMAILGAVESQAVAAGKSLITGSVAVVTAQAQADLLATGKIAAPAA